jgi:hypothetical protein
MGKTGLPVDRRRGIPLSAWAASSQRFLTNDTTRHEQTHPPRSSPPCSAAQRTLVQPLARCLTFHSLLKPFRHNRHLSTETFRDRHPRSFRTTLRKPPIPLRRPVSLDPHDALTEDREPVTTSGNFSSTCRPDYIEQPIPPLPSPYPASRTPITTPPTTTTTTTHPPSNPPPSLYPCPSRHLLPLPQWKASSRSPLRGRRRTAGSASQWRANTAGTGEQAPSPV